jgi:hypothetical protein
MNLEKEIEELRALLRRLTEQADYQRALIEKLKVQIGRYNEQYSTRKQPIPGKWNRSQRPSNRAESA